MEYNLQPETQEDIQLREKLKKKYIATELNLTKEQQHFLNTKLSSKRWRLNNLYTIYTKDNKKQILKFNAAQEKIASSTHPRKIIPKSRQQGVSTFAVAYNLDSCLTHPGYQAGIQSYGQDESDKLAKRALLMWNELDQNVKDILNIKLVSNNQKGMTFSNGSVLKIGNFRGDTLQSLHVSELAKIAKRFPEKAKELKTGAFQAVSAGNKITIESTAEGASGLFYDMCMIAKAIQDSGRPLTPLDFELIFLSWVDDKDCQMEQEPNIPPNIKDSTLQKLHKYFTELETKLNRKLTKPQKNWYIAKYVELGADIKQEYPATIEEAFEQSIEGTYYHDYNLIVAPQNTYDPNLLVYSAMDLGMSDTFSIGFFQVHPDNSVHLIREYHNSGKGLEHYRNVYDALAEKYGYRYGRTYVPHDIMVRELIADNTRFEAMINLGFSPTLVRKHRIADGIEAVKALLPKLIISPECTTTLTALRTYRKKYDKRLGVYLDTPEHDEASHTADMIRYIAMGLRTAPVSPQYKKHKKINKSYDI